MKKHKFRGYLFFTLIIFSMLILFIFWFLQIIFLNSYYRYFKKGDIEQVSKEIIRTYTKDKNNYNNLSMISYKNNVCIELLENDETFYSTGMNNSCMLLDNSSVKKAKNKFMSSKKSVVTFTAYNYRYNEELLVYGEKLADGNVVFVSTPLKIMGSILTVIQKEFIYASSVVLVISFLVAYFLSHIFSNPITKMTEESKKLANGNYDVKFKQSSIEEINELAQTLNKASSELAKTENLRRELLANVSHDLKTPLTLIRANAEMVKDLTYKNEEKRNANLDVIIKETERLNLLVEDILDLSKVKSETMKLELTFINLNDLIKSILTRYEVLKDKDNYKINFEYKKDYMIKADKKRLEQVIYNLINNAINYTGDNKIVNIRLTDNKKFVRLEVIDTGNGIDEEDLKYIWDKYYKVDKKYKRVTYGTGLGLSIVKNILELHKFKYGVKTSNKGTNFYFDIPKK